MAAVSAKRTAVYAEAGDEVKAVVQASKALVPKLAAALLPGHFLLPVQFESFLMPVMVMPILPVAFTGSLFGLPLRGRDLSMLSLVSIIMLAGTVVNSSHAIKLGPAQQENSYG